MFLVRHPRLEIEMAGPDGIGGQVAVRSRDHVGHAPGCSIFRGINPASALAREMEWILLYDI